MKAKALLANHVLITLFGLSSGLFKVAQGAPDLEVFAHLGLGPLAVSVFGAVQAAAAVASWPARSRRWGAGALAACNLLASVGLFAAGVQPFGVVSLLFVVMAAAVAWR